MTSARRRRWPWILGAAVVIVLGVVGILVVPSLLHVDGGSSNQDAPTEDWPLVASGTGDDGRDRRIEILPVEPGGVVDTSALRPGDRFVVTGSGFDGGQGIYVAICAIPDDPGTKPGPCLGGVPSQEAVESPEGTVQFAPSNWINDDWAWKLFGARGFDDAEAGDFTAYIEVPATSDEHLDCRETPCALYTRNDHTAASDRVQDLHIPLRFIG